MEKSGLLFYDAYEDFYAMAGENPVFSQYCAAVFGEDFSQDGFSDLTQLNEFLPLLRLGPETSLLDIGCGNGKTLRYIHAKTGARVNGFDYSENAVAWAKKRIDDGSGAFHFQVGTLDGMDYPPEAFDAVISLDSIYFTADLPAFLKKACSWLKSGGRFLCAYQEGDVKPMRGSPEQSELALALKGLSLPYETRDYTEAAYRLLRHKREVLEAMRGGFERAGLSRWHETALSESLSANVSLAEYAQKNRRTLYWLQK